MVGNPSLQWEISTKLDIAADYSLFGGVISGSLDYFKENRSNILLSGDKRAVPSYFGVNAPTANLGEVDTKGFEIEVRWNKPINRDWRLWGNVFYTRATSKVIEADDPILKPEYQKLRTKRLGSIILT